MCGMLLSAVLVVWHNSALTKFGHIFSILILIGFLQKTELRFIWYALLLAFISFMEGPAKLFRQIFSGKITSGRSGEVLRWLKLTLIPLLLGFIFFVIYYTANARFAALCDRVWESFDFTFELDWDIGRIIFFLTGLIFFSALIFTSDYTQWFNKLPVQLLRKRQKNVFRLSNSPIALKNEYRTGLITIGLLNGLLFIVNMIDLRYIWIEYEDTTPQMLSQYVHEGTYLLILAILLAMLVLLYFFRNNLNFYPENDHLKQLAYLWIIQNCLLALSVGMRNYHYIHEYGLAYKRLGVIWFLILTFSGLLSLYQKIEGKKTLFYLFHVNGWVFYASLILFSLINWDIAITRYNLKGNTKNKIDTWFLLHEMSDKNLYLILENRDLLHTKGVYRGDIDLALLQKQESFKKKLKKRDWRSWNWADERNKFYLTKEELVE